ncbi:MAG: hypothetical protein AAGC58_11265 [Asticcacaulis sp.]
MVAMHLRHMGHRVSLVKAGEYSSAKGAVRALSRMGYDSLEAALDARFVRIAPAEAVVGDIIALPSDCALSALAVRLSNGRVLHSWQGGFSISEPLLFVAAWRVPCLTTDAVVSKWRKDQAVKLKKTTKQYNRLVETGEIKTGFEDMEAENG